MKYTQAKQVKKNPLGKPKAAPKGGPLPKGKPRIIGCGTHQKPEHAPRVV